MNRVTTIDKVLLNNYNRAVGGYGFANMDRVFGLIHKHQLVVIGGKS